MYLRAVPEKKQKGVTKIQVKSLKTLRKSSFPSPGRRHKAVTLLKTNSSAGIFPKPQPDIKLHL